MSAQFEELMKACRRPVRFEALCDKLELSPSACRKLVAEAKAEGYRVRVGGDHVGWGDEPRDKEVVIKPPPVVGGEKSIAIISDIHTGNRHVQWGALNDFVEIAYGRGIRTILVNGDILDGLDKYNSFALAQVGLDAQTRVFFRRLPRKPGLVYHAITGNHDSRFSDAVGLDAGKYIERHFRTRGRKDFTYHGRCSAYVRYGKTLIHMYHPAGSSLSNKIGAPEGFLVKTIQKYGAGLKPQILIVGHFHTQAVRTARGVHGVMLPCFLGKGREDYSKVYIDPQDIGGTILTWTETAAGTIRSFRPEWVNYYQKEKTRGIVGGEGFEDLSAGKAA